MPTNQKKSKTNLKPQKRSITMNALKISMIGLLAVVFLTVGCSQDKRLTGPASGDLQNPQKAQFEPEDLVYSENLANDELGQTPPDEEQSPSKRKTIIGKVKATEGVTGCLYLSTKEGESFTPKTPKSLSLEIGMVIKAAGYVDESIHFFCGNGPAFVIIDYTVLKNSDWTSDTPATHGAETEPAKPQTADAASGNPDLISEPKDAVPIIFYDDIIDNEHWKESLEGYTHYAKGGCLMLTTAKKKVYELRRDKETDILPRDGSYVLVTGSTSLLPYYTCEEATVFNVKSMTILRSNMADQADIRSSSPAGIADGPQAIEVTGKLFHAEPEGACWVFVAKDGCNYELIFSAPVYFRSGTSLHVKGVPMDVTTFCQSGKPLKVISWNVINENKL